MDRQEKMMVIDLTKEDRSQPLPTTCGARKTNIQYLSPEELRNRLEADGAGKCRCQRAFSANLSAADAQTVVGRKLERLAARSPYYLLSE